MFSTFKSQMTGVGVAAIVGLASIVPASAGPMLSNASSLSAAGSDNVVDVRWRGRGAGVAAGIAAGALIGGAIAGSAYGYGPYGYGYAEPYAYSGYGYPAYGAYAYAPRRQYYYETPVGPPAYSYGYGYPY